MPSSSRRLWSGLRIPRVVLSLVVLVLVTVDGGADRFPVDTRALLGLAALGNMILVVKSIASERRHVVAQLSMDAMMALAVLMLADVQATPLVWVALLVPVVGAVTVSSTFAVGTWLAMVVLYTSVQLLLPTAAESSLSVGLQQLLAVVLIGFPVARWSQQLHGQLSRLVEEKRRANTQATWLQRVGSHVQQLSTAGDVDEIDRLAVAVDGVIDSSRAELWDVSVRQPRLILAAGRPLSNATDLFLETSAEMTVSGRSDRVELNNAGYGSAMSLKLKPRKAILRLWFDGLTVESERVQAAELLANAMRRSYLNANEVKRLTAWSEELDYRVKHDTLTGLLNRHGLRSSLRDGGGESVLFIDLDGFKPVNDDHGHDVGDALLQIVARRLESASNEDVLLARVGGDEFVAVTYDVEWSELEQLRSDVLAAIDEPIAVASLQLSIGASVGLAAAANNEAFDRVLRRADQNMYEEKRQGKANHARSHAKGPAPGDRIADSHQTPGR